MPHGNNNYNKNIKICAHTGQHGILGLGTSGSPRMSAPSLPFSPFVLNYYQRKQEKLFLSTNNFFNFEYSGLISMWVQNPPRPTVRATTRTGYMMTSPKFSTWRPNQGTRSRVTFQLFATPRNDLFPQYLKSVVFE